MAMVSKSANEKGIERGNNVYDSDSGVAKKQSCSQ